MISTLSRVEFLDYSPRRAWHDGCFWRYAVTPLRRKVGAVSLLIAMLAMTGSALAQAVHPVCLAKAHECGNTAKISDCCCGNEGFPNSDSTPGQARTEVRPDVSATLALWCAIHIAAAPRTAMAIETSPPRLCPLDLPTLFAALLI